MSASAFPGNPFWDWSIHIYGWPGVADACLTLQERHALDVNLLLFCCWAAERGQSFDTNDMKRVAGEVRAWHIEAVTPLRRIRQRLKGGIQGAPAELVEMIRRRIAAVELDAEHLEQIVLSRYAAEPEQDRTDFVETASANLGAYAAASGFSWRSEDRTPLATLLAAAAPAQPLDRIRRALSAVCAESGPCSPDRPLHPPPSA